MDRGRQEREPGRENTTATISENQTVHVEGLNAAVMLKNHHLAKRRLA
jgi:hypothetical protein